MDAFSQMNFGWFVPNSFHTVEHAVRAVPHADAVREHEEAMKRVTG